MRDNSKKESPSGERALSEELENIIYALHNLRCMALVADKSLDVLINPGHCFKDTPDYYFIGSDEKAVIIFALGDVVRRIDELDAMATSAAEKWSGRL